MTVYVDEIIDTTRADKRRWPYSKSCHMMADDPEELYQFADKLGLRRQWAQHVGRPTLHYDLTVNKRAQALALGAVYRHSREWAIEYINKRRLNG